MNEVGLSAAISDWMEELIAKRHGLATELIVEGQKKKLDDDVRAILFRNVRELLTNTVKHARASKITVRVEFGDMNLKVVVQDDGVGHNPDAFSENGESPSGFGLFSIQERMTDLGGALEIESEPGKGCRAVLTLPVEKGKKGRGRR
jgi:signal transduction histidine kinase